MQTGSVPPQASDFSHKAIQKAVRKRGLMHWLTLYPPAIGVPCGIAGLLFDYPILYLVTLGACFISLCNAIINIFFRNERIASIYISRLNKKLKEHEQLVLKSVHKNLQDCSSIKGAEQYASQGAEQFKRIQEKYQNVQDLLERKLRSGELTFGRFIGAAEQVCLSALDNLKQVVTTLQSAGSIDPDYVKSRLDWLAKLEQPGEDDRKEMETLQKRLRLREEQLQKVNRLLTRNEEAMTNMEETTAAIAVMQTGSRFATSDYEDAITQLQELAQRVHIYNNH